MARKLRLQFEGAIYHVTVRGNARRRMFLDDRDRERFLWRLVAGDLYLLRLSRYIHLNPVRTREAQSWPMEQRRQRLRTFRWSSYRGYTEESRTDELVEYGPLPSMMGDSGTAQREQYREYVESGLAETDQELEELLKESPRALGDREFRRWVDTQYQRLRQSQAHERDIAFRREAVVRDAGGIVSLVAGEFGVGVGDMRRQMRGTLARPMAAYLLCRHAGLTQRAAGKPLGYGTGAAVSLQLKLLRQALETDTAMKKRLVRLEKRILELR
jgi:hypothetical protein